MLIQRYRFFAREQLSQNLDFFCESISIFFSLSSFFPFFSLLIAIFIAHFIVFLSHEILAGFFSNKGRDL